MTWQVIVLILGLVYGVLMFLAFTLYVFSKLEATKTIAEINKVAGSAPPPGSPLAALATLSRSLSGMTGSPTGRVSGGTDE